MMEAVYVVLSKDNKMTTMSCQFKVQADLDVQAGIRLLQASRYEDVSLNVELVEMGTTVKKRSNNWNSMAKSMAVPFL